ncbi:MAG: hypothetical protein AAGK47_05865, partial [Bacteroidota bacterium]
MNKLYFILLLLCCGIVAQAQTLTAYETAAREAYADEDYSTAFRYYEKAVQIEPDKIENLYQLGEIARQLHAYELAEKYYLQVAAHEQQADYPLANMLLAIVKKNLGKYADAGELLQQFIDSANLDEVSNADIEIAKRELANCRLAPELLNDSLDYISTTNLTHINTINSEVAPVERNGQIYYSSLRFINPLEAYEPNRAHLSIYKTNDTLAGQQLAFIKKDVPTANTAFSADGKTMYYTLCDYEKAGKYRCEIYTRRMLANDAWGEAIRLPNLINEPGYHTTHPNIGIDEDSGTEWLFFASNRPDGEGGMDIWCTVVGADGSYNSLVNISTINTAADEITPFFHTNRQRLYFSSNGHLTNIGGFDIFKTDKNAGRWMTPKNVGVPLNSSYNDTYYTLNADGNIAYFSSNRPGGVYPEEYPEFSTCCPDIYRADIDLPIDLIVSSYNGLDRSDLMGVNVQLVNETTRKIVPFARTTEGHRAFFGLEPEQNYLLIGTLTDYTSDTVRFNTKMLGDVVTLEKDLALFPPVTLRTLVFDEVTREPLTGVKIEITELTQNIAFAKDTKQDSHQFDYVIDFEKQYRIVATKPNYKSSERIVSTQNIEKTLTQLTSELYLVPDALELPIVLYFDNDHPNPRTLDVTTELDYKETFDAYYARRGEFESSYVRSAGTQNRVSARAAMEAFFEEDVLGGLNRLETASESLLTYLQSGNSIEIVLQGYASPLSNSQYNENLTLRRIACVKNYFRNYRNGIFRTYLNNRQLVFTDDPRGENQAPVGISSEYDDPNSVYSNHDSTFFRCANTIYRIR